MRGIYYPALFAGKKDMKIAITDKNITVTSIIPDDADVSEAFDSIIEVLSRIYPRESVMRILAEKSSLAGER